MGYSEYLKNLLRPMRVYELENSYNAKELETLGQALDNVCSISDELLAECAVPTAEKFGLTKYEDILPKIPIYIDLENRRQAIQALLRIDDTSFTQNALNDALWGCGVRAVVNEADEHYTVSVAFPDVRGIPEPFEKLKDRIESILPCHLNVIYVFSYMTWDEFESYFQTWNELDGKEIAWEKLEVYYEK